MIILFSSLLYFSNFFIYIYILSLLFYPFNLSSPVLFFVYLLFLHLFLWAILFFSLWFPSLLDFKCFPVQYRSVMRLYDDKQEKKLLYYILFSNGIVNLFCRRRFTNTNKVLYSNYNSLVLCPNTPDYSVYS